MDKELQLIHQCAKRARNNMLIGMFFMLLVGVGMLVGGIMSNEGTGTKIGLIAFGGFITLLCGFGGFKILPNMMNPDKNPVLMLLKEKPEDVESVVVRRITSQAGLLSRSIYEVHVFDKNGKDDHILGPKKKQIGDLIEAIKKYAPDATYDTAAAPE